MEIPSLRRAALVALFTLVGLVIVPIGLLDLFFPDLDIAGCTSDNLSAVAAAVREYRAEHGGKLPVQREEFRQFLLQAKGHDYLYCNRRKEPLVWRPSAVRDSGQGLVLVMCPPKSHGLIRRYAWAIVVEGVDLGYAVVRGNEATVRRPAAF